MKRLKAWFHSVVVAEAEKVLASLLGGFKKAIEDHTLSVFSTERARLDVDIRITRADLKDIFEKMHSDAVLRLAGEMKAHMAAEEAAFEARVQKTLIDTIKAPPAHWRADEQTKTTEDELRKVK
jgi:hypothetical protein